MKYDPDGYVLAWFGGESTSVSVYDVSGRQVGYWQIMPDESGRLDPKDVRQSMIDHMSSGEPYPS